VILGLVRRPTVIVKPVVVEPSVVIPTVAVPAVLIFTVPAAAGIAAPAVVVVIVSMVARRTCGGESMRSNDHASYSYQPY
jgi:hypothetical protein